MLRSGVATHQVWQFGTYDLSVPASNLGDVNSIYFNDTEYKVLGFQHAAAMLEKEVGSQRWIAGSRRRSSRMGLL